MMLPSRKNPEPRARAAHSTRAFSLIELLAVMAILALITAFTIPAMNQIGGASRLTSAGLSLSDQMALARQAAITRNRPVEFRIYKESAEPKALVAFQSYMLDGSGEGSVPLGKLTKLPPGVGGSTSAVLSTLASGTFISTPPQPAEMAGYYVFQFRPDGSTNLDSAQLWFITIMSSNSLQVPSDTPPPNFFTVQVNPVSGKSKTFRP